MARKDKKVCSKCGASLREYRHGLSYNLVIGLLRLKVVANGGPINLKHLGMDRDQWDNFQKLRYWRLVRKYYKDGKRVAGVWEITRKGKWFLSGEITTQKVVVTFRGNRIGYEGERINIYDILPDFHYKKREDYLRDATPHED